MRKMRKVRSYDGLIKISCIPCLIIHYGVLGTQVTIGD